MDLLNRVLYQHSKVSLKEITRTISFLYICERRGNVLSVEQYKKRGGGKQHFFPVCLKEEEKN